MKHSKFINRELSWLEFNQRVLARALDEELPLLERLKFIAITSSNLKEFFMVRVGGLKMLAARSSSKTDPAGLTAEQQLDAISRRTHAMIDQQYSCYCRDIEPRLEAAGIKRVLPRQLSEQQRRHVESVFEHEILPLLTPIAFTMESGFPLLASQALCLGVRLRPETGRGKKHRYAVIPIGTQTSRLVTVPNEEDGYEFMLVEDLIGMFVSSIFRGESVLECVPFRISRNADMSVREDLASDLLSEMQEVLYKRNRSDCVHLEVDHRITKTFLSFLCRLLDVAERDIYRAPALLDFTGLMPLTQLHGYTELKDEPWRPQPCFAVEQGAGVLDTLGKRDLLLYHPYESFEPVLRLIDEAADDPDVLSIKVILYRTSRESPIVEALRRAAGSGKHVTAIIELKARFDEARNIEWAKTLSDEGVQVIYGVKGLKTHSKVCFIVRREPEGLRRYMHFGTGNYNEKTAELYSDVSYMTSDEDLGVDAAAFLNSITGYSQPRSFRKLEAAPIGLRDRIIELIEDETERRKHGQKALIQAKLNSLADPRIIEALYRASRSGVKVRLNVRGICCLRPGVPGLSKNIAVTSIVDRFLEHGRIMYFYHGGDERVFISSADWMPRNLDKRVEMLIPVEDTECKSRLKEILDLCFADTVSAWRLLPEGHYKRIRPVGRRKRVRSQEALYRAACARTQEAQRLRRTVFEPHRPPSSEG